MPDDERRPDLEQARDRAALTGVGRPELAELPARLQPGERVIDVGAPMRAGVFGLLVLTDRRLVFTKAGSRATWVEVDLADVRGVEWKRSFRGRSRLTVQTATGELAFTELPNEQGSVLESGLRSHRLPARPAVAPTPTAAGPPTPTPAGPTTPGRPVTPAPAPQVGGLRLDLRGKTALVTGSSQGIGLAIATGLAAAGAAVVLTARGEPELGDAARQVRTTVEGAQVRTVTGDVATDAGIVALLAALPDVDVLVLAGTDVQPGSVPAAVGLIRGYLPGMQDRGWGRVLQVVAGPADLLDPVSCAAPAALVAASRSLAGTVAGSGVTVNALLTAPPETHGALLGRPVEPAEVAAVVVFLASPLASATTGLALRLGGGHEDPIRL